MIVVFALGIHLLLLSVYAFMIQTNRSRLNMTYLLLALFLPFVGELCLIAAEVGKVPEKSKYVNSPNPCTTISAKLSNYSIPSDWKETVLGEEGKARYLLMSIMDNATENELAEILKTALHSKSSEVSHIAAAGLTRLNKKHEDAIAAARDACTAKADNTSILASYIDAVNDYITSGLPDEFSREELKETELRLLDRYLNLMPQDEYYIKLKKNIENPEAKTDE